MSKNTIHILTIVETRIFIQHNEIQHAKYNIYEYMRANRLINAGGGVMLVIDKTLKSEILECEHFETFDFVIVKIFSAKTSKFKLFGSIYCSSIQNREKLTKYKANDDINHFI